MRRSGYQFIVDSITGQLEIMPPLKDAILRSAERVEKNLPRMQSEISQRSGGVRIFQFYFQKIAKKVLDPYAMH